MWILWHWFGRHAAHCKRTKWYRHFTKYDDAILAWSTRCAILLVVCRNFVVYFGNFCSFIWIYCERLFIWIICTFVQCFLFSPSVSLLFAFIHHVSDAHSVFHLPATAVRCEKLSLAIMLNKTKILKYTCNKFSVKSKLVWSKPCTIHAANSNVGSYKNLIEWWRNFFTIAHLVRCSKRDREHELEEEGKKPFSKKLVFTFHRTKLKEFCEQVVQSNLANGSYGTGISTNKLGRKRTKNEHRATQYS